LEVDNDGEISVVVTLPDGNVRAWAVTMDSLPWADIRRSVCQ
jgi:hypothetical protein